MKNKLKCIRIKRGLGIRELSLRLQLSQQAVYQQENRGIRNVQTAERYAAVLNCDPAELIDFKIPMKTTK